MGASTTTMAEADFALLVAARLFADTRAGVVAKGGEVAQAIGAGMLAPDAIEDDLFGLVVAPTPVVRRPEDITVFKSVGSAAFDLVAAELVCSEHEPAGPSREALEARQRGGSSVTGTRGADAHSNLCSYTRAGLHRRAGAARLRCAGWATSAAGDRDVRRDLTPCRSRISTMLPLEAETIGHGGSGRNVGLVNAGLWLPPDDVEAALGREAGQRLNDALAGGPAYVFDLIARHAIACEATRAGTLHCAHARAGTDELARRFRQLQARGAPVTLLDAAAAGRAPRAACHRCPRRAARPARRHHPTARVRARPRAGGAGRRRALARQSPATAIAHDGARWTATCAQGSVRARTLLLAVNAYAFPPRAPWHPRYRRTHYFQMATSPLSSAVAATILPGHQGAWGIRPP